MRVVDLCAGGFLVKFLLHLAREFLEISAICGKECYNRVKYEFDAVLFFIFQVSFNV